MKQVILQPEIHKFDTCAQFAEEFKLGKGDLLFTNEQIYNKYFAPLKLDIPVIFRRKYGTGEPTDEMAEAIMKDVVKAGCERVVAVGGGSMIDVAKVLAAAGDETIDELYALAPNLPKRRRLVIVPTTCGSGSEVTSISILNRTRIGVKMGLVGPALFPDSAVLIPVLLEDLPFDAFAASSIDALIHAVESSLSPKATPYSKLFGYKAIEMIIKGFQVIAQKGREARIPLLEDFLIASNYAGIAFGTAGCAAVHAMSYPLGSRYHVAHGESNYAIFTGVLRNYMELKQDGEIAVLNAFLENLLDGEGDLYDRLENLLNVMLQKKALHEYGATEEDLVEFADTVIQKQTRLMGNNFVPLDEARVLKIYRELY